VECKPEREGSDKKEDFYGPLISVCLFRGLESLPMSSLSLFIGGDARENTEEIEREKKNRDKNHTVTSEQR